MSYYRIPAICRVPKAHGEGPKTHGIHVRRARSTANPRRRPTTTAKPTSSCAFYRAHGKDLCRVFGAAHGKLKHMTAETSTGNGNGARRRRRIRSSPCAMDPGTRRRFELRRVPGSMAHGGLPVSLPCVALAHGEEVHKQRRIVILPCVRIQTHGKVTI